MIIIKQGGDEIISGANMKNVPNILWLEEIRKEDIISVGGKEFRRGFSASSGIFTPGFEFFEDTLEKFFHVR